MPDVKEIPQIAVQLYEMAREYLVQETVEPAKRLGKHAGLGLGGAVLLSIGALLFVLGTYYGLKILFPEGEWFVVLAKTVTALLAGAASAIVFWRMGNADNEI